MNKVKLIADSTCDLNEELLKRYSIDIIPLKVTLGEESYQDGVDIHPAEIIDYVAENKSLPKTAAPSILDYETIFRKYIDEGYDIVHTGIGSKMSSSYNSARMAAEEVAPDRIFIVDSQNLSTGTGLILCKGGDMMLEGKSAVEIAAEMERLVPKVRASFVVDTLDYLYMGGRCSSLENFVASVLKLRPRLIVTDGTIISDQKYRGNFERCLANYIKDTIDGMKNIDKTRVFITNARTKDPSVNDADYEVAKAEVEKLNAGEICYSHAGCVIFSHCGPRTLGILYIEND